MKKRGWIIVVLLSMCLQPLATAETERTAEQWPTTISQYSMDELLQLRALIDEELLLRGYAEQAFKTYIINKNTHKFHLPTCSSVQQMKEKNKGRYEGDREMLVSLGLEPCGNCHP